jgi:Holliday junction resolvase RusA-like endonuclease
MQNKLCFTIPGTIRIKKNSRRIYGFGKFKKNLPSKAYETWELQARALFVMKHFGFPTFTRPCHVQAMFYFKGPEPDLSGCMESVADCLQGLLYENDSQIVSWDGSRKEHSKDNPRTEIMVEW